MSQVNTPLLELFRAHGVEAAAEGEWVTFPGRAWKASAAIVREMPQQSAVSVQLKAAGTNHCVSQTRSLSVAAIPGGGATLRRSLIVILTR